MSGHHVNLVKLCVGVDSVRDLEHWQAERFRQGLLQNPEHVTRMRPRRETEILNGGSLYWVFRGFILARQKVIALERRVCSDQITRCAIILDRAIIRTEAMPRRPFQGWRYLEPSACPKDLSRKELHLGDLPPDVDEKLAEIGVI